MTVEMKSGEHPAPVDYEKPEEEVEIHVPRRNIERAIIAILALIGAGGGSLALHDKVSQPSPTEVTQDFRHIHDVLEGKVEANYIANLQRFERVQAEVMAMRQEISECRKNLLDYLMQHRPRAEKSQQNASSKQDQGQE